MPIQVLDRGPSLGGNLGQALGTGLSSGLDSLTQAKMQQVARNQRAMGIEALGYSPQQSQQLSGLPDSLLVAELNNRSRQQIESQKQQRENMGLEALADEYGIAREGYNAFNDQQPTSTNPNNPGPRQEGSPLPAGIDRRQAAQILKNRETRERAERSLDLKEREVASKESKEARLFSDPFINKKESAGANIKDLNQLKELTDQDLVAGGRAWLARSLGVDELARNLPTELAQKLVARLKTNVASAYPKGTRITNFLDQTFQKTLPDLINSPEGIRLISDLLIDSEMPHLLRDQALQTLMEGWGGRVPPNATHQINKMIEPQLEDLERHSMDLIISSKLPQDEEPGTEGIYKGKKYIFGEDRIWHLMR